MTECKVLSEENIIKQSMQKAGSFPGDRKASRLLKYFCDDK